MNRVLGLLGVTALLLSSHAASAVTTRSKKGGVETTQWDVNTKSGVKAIFQKGPDGHGGTFRKLIVSGAKQSGTFAKNKRVDGDVVVEHYQHRKLGPGASASKQMMLTVEGPNKGAKYVGTTIVTGDIVMNDDVHNGTSHFTVRDHGREIVNTRGPTSEPNLTWKQLKALKAE